MSKKTRPYRDLLLERLANPEVAEHYLEEALKESPESFLEARKAVSQARAMSKIPEEAVSRPRN